MTKNFLTLLILLMLMGCQNIIEQKNYSKNNLNIMDKQKAQAFIDQATDKSAVPKEVWLTSGLTEAEYHILWEKGTERAGTSPLNEEKRKGKFVTKACGLEVFSSDHKYESGTGWPSFWEANKENIVLEEDHSWGMKRIEVKSKCGEHLGHVFPDGPSDKTGLRYCMNGAALEFIPEKE